MNDSIDDANLEDLAERVRTQSAEAPGSDTERVTIRSLGAVDLESLTTLVEAFEGDVTSGTTEPVFVLSEANADRLSAGTENEDDPLEACEKRLGHPIHVDEGMPDDTVLLLAPDAVDGTELVEPEGVACGIVGTE
ncbi:hypothetical protein SAMN05444422_102176 [Halobiforma haloterrestris]|uniref:Uncharacterized protein n=1 Tax=Natronobacterium haloterrestre TaxID=148448 RepID=A0A1I1E3H9_NATHA|nr:hypothetical protein [Halobiforma haloterrestris]SFB81664.1 hypothetical protein SAMN05444422_102176 [Halobiforma haloterrestris]